MSQWHREMPSLRRIPQTSGHLAVDVPVEEDKALEDVDIVVEVARVAGEVLGVAAGEEAARVGAVVVPPSGLCAVGVRARGTLAVLPETLGRVSLEEDGDRDGRMSLPQKDAMLWVLFS